MNPLDEFLSHPHKPLRVHVDGVRAKTNSRTALKIADTAALFHDLGKLNPNFQLKIKGKAPEGYDNHSYLSTLAFLSFLLEGDGENAAQIGTTQLADIIAVVALISHHHGHLHDLKSLLSKDQIEQLEKFLLTKPHLPASDFLTQWQTHHAFDVANPKSLQWMKGFIGVADRHLDQIPDKLPFFLDTQFAFASLIEADKRDAGDNAFYNRAEQLERARIDFSAPLQSKFNSLNPQEEAGDTPETLNDVRTRLRLQSLDNLASALENGDRIFSLTAPTGAGKTFMLLALADLIRQAKGDYALIYGLPFLSITEQVEAVCKTEIWSDWPELLTRQDSRTRRADLEKLIEEAESDPQNTSELLRAAFSGETFDGAFTLTTFVQIFETLLSNRNATLLKLPNFSKSIFLLDEIQALPPRLYVFFSAFLHEFCARFDCYAILSTATMPSLGLPVSVPRNFFSRYPAQTPELLGESAFTSPVFDRYQIQPVEADWTRETLATQILETQQSALVILNTIEDSLEVWKLVKARADEETTVLLLNTRFILADRKEKIRLCKERLENNKRMILISTQMIEAGVDVDFPVVFRDWCPLPSLIQAAGRCNRNNKIACGQVFFGRLVGDKGKPRAPLVYRDSADRWLLDFAREKISKVIHERELLPIQRDFFNEINTNLEVGRAKLKVNGERQTDNLIKRIQNGDFAVVGSFQLIEESDFGEEFRYYIPQSDEDVAWNDLEAVCLAQWKAKKAAKKWSYADNKTWELKIEAELRALSERVVAIRCRPKFAPEAWPRDNGEIELLGLRRLALWCTDYSFERGLASAGSESAIL